MKMIVFVKRKFFVILGYVLLITISLWSKENNSPTLTRQVGDLLQDTVQIPITLLQYVKNTAIVESRKGIGILGKDEYRSDSTTDLLVIEMEPSDVSDNVSNKFTSGALQICIELPHNSSLQNINLKTYSKSHIHFIDYPKRKIKSEVSGYLNIIYFSNLRVLLDGRICILSSEKYKYQAITFKSTDVEVLSYTEFINKLNQIYKQRKDIFNRKTAKMIEWSAKRGAFYDSLYNQALYPNNSIECIYSNGCKIVPSLHGCYAAVEYGSEPKQYMKNSKENRVLISISGVDDPFEEASDDEEYYEIDVKITNLTDQLTRFNITDTSRIQITAVVSRFGGNRIFQPVEGSIVINGIIAHKLTGSIDVTLKTYDKKLDKDISFHLKATLELPVVPLKVIKDFEEKMEKEKKLWNY